MIKTKGGEIKFQNQRESSLIKNQEIDNKIIIKAILTNDVCVCMRERERERFIINLS